MGLLNIYDRIMDASRAKQVEGILGSAATTSPQGPMQPTGLLGGQINPLVAATRIQEVGGNTYDPIATRVMQQQQQATQAQYQAMLQQARQQFEAQQPTTMQRNIERYTPNMTPDQRNQFGRDVLQKPQVQMQMGSIPAGAERLPSGHIKYLPGSKPFNEIQSKINYLAEGRGNVQNMIDSLDKYGSELWGAESGKQAVLYGQVLSYIAKLRDMGVLQPGEVEMMQNQITDPSGKEASITSNARMKAQYGEVLRQLNEKVESLGNQYKDWGINVPEQASNKEPVVQDTGDGWTVKRIGK